MAVDDFPTKPNGSPNPFRDTVYVTWTEFSSDGTALIYESHSMSESSSLVTFTTQGVTSPLGPLVGSGTVGEG
jgi:hypothetical protein